MPQVQAPAPQPTKSDIESFAKAYFNIELTSWQLEVLHAYSKGKTVTGGKRAGLTTVRKVMFAYLQEGLKTGGRVRLPQHPLPPVDKKRLKGLTKHGRILAMIQRPGGAYNFELSRFALKYTGIISELRKDGYNIVADRQYLKNGRASNTWRYRLAGK